MQKLLMCSPNYFNVSYEINPWMTNHINSVDTTKATESWNELYQCLSNYASVNVLDGVDQLPDLVFTANAGFIKNNLVILSRFSKQERSYEENIFRKYFEDQKFLVIQTSYSYEGEGDHLVDSNGRHWIAYGFRTDIRSHTEISSILSQPLYSVELVDPRWYHLDTCFCPLLDNELLWYPDAFSDESQQLIRNSFKYTIDVSHEDALLFCCNCVKIDNNLFLPYGSSVSKKLKNFGYNVHEFDLSEFIKAGGAAKCLTLHYH